MATLTLDPATKELGKRGADNHIANNSVPDMNHSCSPACLLGIQHLIRIYSSPRPGIGSISDLDHPESAPPPPKSAQTRHDSLAPGGNINLMRTKRATDCQRCHPQHLKLGSWPPACCHVAYDAMG